MNNIRTQCDIDTNPYICEMCERSMTEEDHDFSDICDDCRENIKFLNLEMKNENIQKKTAYMVCRTPDL